MDDMILDMDTFDFSQIDSAPEAPVEEPQVEEEFIEEEAEEVSEDEQADEEESEVAEDEEAESEEEEVVEDEEPSEEEVDFETYELTLPSGETVVMADLVNGYKNATEVAAMKAEVEAMKSEFEEKSGNLVSMLELAKLEADRVIEDYVDFDWATLSKEDPASYVENREFLDKYKARAKEIRKSIETLREKEAEEQSKAAQEKAREANVVLARDIPGWGPDMYKKLISYAVENGANEEDMLNLTDAFAFKLLHKAMEFEKGKQVVKAKVKKVGSPKKVVKPAAKATKAPSKNAAREAAMKKYEQTGDPSAIFAFLDD